MRSEALSTVNPDRQRNGTVRVASPKRRPDRRRIHAWCADLTATPLPLERFEAVVVTRYLQRDLFEPIRHTVRPGGIVLYETFTSTPNTR